MEAPVTREQMRILFVEDSERDVKLECRQLERENVAFNWQAVSSDEGLRKALKEFDPHIVLSDF